MRSVLVIRDYEPRDEQGWLRCRVLAFLETAYHDDVKQAKEHYHNPALELVAELEGQIVGLLDVEYDLEPAQVCTAYETRRGGMIWHITTHPDHKRRGVGAALLGEAVRRSRALGLEYLEAWTRDDPWVRGWYERSGFSPGNSYWHVYVEGQDGLSSEVPGLRPAYTFAHYTGSEIEAIRGR
ncbi:MAG: GNAT family N-acetyltransferase [Meiothermus sp.]|nr:GNAT family N-acetyltransferase [Meiothermus sp.]